MNQKLKILFVCSQNRWRSLTAEKMYARHPAYSVRSAGTEPGARIRVTRGHIGWADMIFAMEKRHFQRLRARFGRELAGKRLVCLHIPDHYEFQNAKLIALLKTKLARHIDVPA